MSMLQQKLYQLLTEVMFGPGIRYPRSFVKKLNLIQSVRFVHDKKTGAILVLSDHPGFYYLDRGVRPHTMMYLLGETVPIKTRDGRVIFRKVTIESIMRGKWKHPGIPPQHYIRKLSEKVRKRTDILQELMKSKVDKALKEGIEKLKKELGHVV